MTAQFWLGVATIPALVAVAYGAYTLKAVIETYWITWRKPWWTLGDANLYARARQGADVALARRSWHIATPFGVAIVYRSKDDPAVSYPRVEAANRFRQVMKDLADEQSQEVKNAD